MEESAHLPLNQLPPDHLGLILGSKHLSYLVLRLWMCGDSRLNSRLAAGITYINLKASWSLQSGFPSVLLRLRSLRYLSIKSKGRLFGNPMAWSGIALSLSPILETLKISCFDCDTAMRNFAPDWTATAPKFIETEYPMGKSTFIDLAQHMPRLTKLELTGTASGRPVPFFAQDLVALPPTLTELRVSLQRRGHPNMMSILPRSLLRLRSAAVGPANDAGIADWLESPPNLEHIDVINYYYPQPDFTWVPRSLRHLKIDKIGSTFFFDDQAALSLPTDYYSANINVESDFSTSPGFPDSSNWVSMLSSRLTTLTANSSRVSLAEVVRYPRTLTSLTLAVQNVKWKSGLPQPFDWPPSLSSLSIAPFNLTKRDLLAFHNPSRHSSSTTVMPRANSNRICCLPV